MGNLNKYLLGVTYPLCADSGAEDAALNQPGGKIPCSLTLEIWEKQYFHGNNRNLKLHFGYIIFFLLHFSVYLY
jgi:hypothetical protein